MTEKKLESAELDALPDARAYANDDYDLLTDREKELLELERKINADLDRQLIDKPNAVPKAVWFIIPNEFCERFCYYGVQPLLNIYFRTASGLDKTQSKTYTHAFSMMAYFFPLGGAALSDSFLTKYYTIVYLSIVYLIGVILLSIFSINGVVGNLALPGVEGSVGTKPVWSIFLPLVLIAMGTGGIKPCVSAHGGDQYLPHQKKGIDWFFSMFYVAINLGAFITQFVTPLLKDKYMCWGANCYFAAFILPAGLFFVAIAIFIMGHRYYRIVPALGEFLPWKALVGTVYAGQRWIAASKEERKAKGNWLNFAEDKVGSVFVEEIRDFGVMFAQIIPMVFFWMIYNQNGTEWQDQYLQMNYELFPGVTVYPEMSGNINTILIIIFVPILANLVYPWCENRGYNFNLLRRMTLGFFLVVLSFGVSALVQYSVDAHWDGVSDATRSNCSQCVSGWLQLPQWILLSLGEALASPIGNQFAYQESGRQMRSTCTAFWLLTISIGNLLIVVLEQALVDSGLNTTNKLWVYTAIGLAANIWFAVSARFYTFRADRAPMNRGSQQAVETVEIESKAEEL